LALFLANSTLTSSISQPKQKPLFFANYIKLPPTQQNASRTLVMPSIPPATSSTTLYAICYPINSGVTLYHASSFI